jgi:hypothetical protein
MQLGSEKQTALTADKMRSRLSVPKCAVQSLDNHFRSD